MHSRRLACLLLGVWLGGGLVMALLALDSPRSVDRLLAQTDPALTLQIKALGSADARLLLEYQAARQSRRYFESWAVAQIVLGGVFFFFLLFATAEGKTSLFLALLMLAGVLGQQLLLMLGLLAPGLAGSSSRLSGETARLRYDGGYWALEIGKVAIALVLVFRLVQRRHAPSGHARQTFHLADEAGHRRVSG